MQITRHYYALWLGAGEDIGGGIKLVYSPARNAAMEGYSDAFDILALYGENGAVIAYGDKAKDKIELLRRDLTSDIDSARSAVERIYGVKASRGLKFLYTGETKASDSADVSAVTLGGGDYADYRRFFFAAHPSMADFSGEDELWLHEYFDSMAARRTCCGVYDGGRLVSCTDAPQMPFLPELTQEIGINTLPDFRGRGCAYAACALSVRNIADAGRCPMWSCGEGNIASERLAYKLGFVRYGEYLCATL